jgi:hypothetical protein
MADETETKAIEPVIVGLDDTGSGSKSYSSVTTEDEKQASSAVYADGGLKRFYEPIEGYEGKHRWDPQVIWTEKEEKVLIRKVRGLLTDVLFKLLILIF